MGFPEGENEEEEGVVPGAKPLPGQSQWGAGSLDLAMERLVTAARAALEQRWGARLMGAVSTQRRRRAVGDG